MPSEMQRHQSKTKAASKKRTVTQRGATTKPKLPAIQHPLDAVSAPELVIGLVAPLGVDLDLVTNVIVRALRDVKYQSRLIRLSSFFSQIAGLKTTLKTSPEDDRIESHMKAGTELRIGTKWGDFLALLAAARIRQERQSITTDPKEPAKRTAYILRSLKHSNEIETLRDIYGDGFIAISIYTPKELRKLELAKTIAKSHRVANQQQFLPRAEQLINIDEREEGTPLGQNISGAFPRADVFLDGSSRAALNKSVPRFIELFFGHQFLTPTRDEAGMFQARAAALRSADLSRQVGAAIVNRQGDVIALGCNDVPKAGGGLYWSNDDGLDGRDFQRGFDPSSRAKGEIIAETLEAFKHAGILTKQAANDISATVEKLLDGDMSQHVQTIQISNLLEFGRIVHAEMSAITDAARRGISLTGTTLFCTTFPCHLCARLIIASGIERVVFIEPYPKSKTQELYSDSVTVDHIDREPSRVNFQSFVGVAPNRYMSLFRIIKRKDDRGNALEWEKDMARPRMRRFVPSYISLEQKVVDAIPGKLKEAGLSLA